MASHKLVKKVLLEVTIPVDADIRRYRVGYFDRFACFNQARHKVIRPLRKPAQEKPE